METIFSLSLYIVTFFAGFILDNKPEKNKLRTGYIVWLYIFLCFGYMTGSDWRAYELDFNEITRPFSDNYIREPAFGTVFFLFKKCIGDFYLTLGILKCLYLFSLIRLLKVYSNHYLLAIAISLPISTLFVLIDNPLRFMVALTVVNVALLYQRKNKNVICYALLILAVFFHNTAVFFLLIPIVFKLSVRLYSISSVLLICFYIVVTYLSSNADLINHIQTSVFGFVMMHMETKDYLTHYATTDNEAFFSLGSLIRIGFSCFVILTKGSVEGNSKSEKFLYGMAICDMLLSRVLTIIPTGFRLAIPFDCFYALYLAFLFSKKSLISYVIVGYLFLSMCNRLYYNSYTYIPYTNSIYHIVFQDYDSYSYRSDYNYNEYTKRTGKSFYDRN